MYFNFSAFLKYFIQTQGNCLIRIFFFPCSEIYTRVYIWSIYQTLISLYFFFSYIFASMIVRICQLISMPLWSEIHFDGSIFKFYDSGGCSCRQDYWGVPHSSMKLVVPTKLLRNYGMVKSEQSAMLVR